MSTGVLVVGETPSLGRAIVDVLEAGGIPAQFVLDSNESKESYRAVVAACNAPYCSTVRKWLRGELPGSSLVVVGTRDPLALTSPGVRRIDLPLRPKSFVAVVRSLL